MNDHKPGIPHDFLILFWTPVRGAEERWQPPVRLAPVAPRRTLAGFYISSPPCDVDGGGRYRCRVVPGLVWYQRRLAILLGAALDPRVTEVCVNHQRGRAKDDRTIGAVDISVGSGLHTGFEVSGRFRALPRGLVWNLKFVQWRPSGTLQPLAECAQRIVVGRPKVAYRPAAAAEEFPFGSPCVALGWQSTRGALPAEVIANGALRVGIEGIRRVSTSSPLCGAADE